MMRPLAASIAFSSSLAVLAGCQAPDPAQFTTAQSMELADPSERADVVWEAIQETLRRHDFVLDRVDRRDGVVTTMPVVSQQYWEIWRRDVATAHDLWEATLNPIRRWVEVTVRRGEDGAWTELALVVHKERFSAPDRQFNNSAAAYRFFGDKLPTTSGEPSASIEDERWLAREADPALAAYLLRQILKRAGVA